MTVSLIRSAESHTGTTGSVSQASFTFAAGIAGDAPKGILVYVFQGASNTDAITSVTYGGVNVPAVTGGRAEDTTTEPGACEAFFLGSGVPSGAPSGGVVVTRTNNTTTMYAVAYLLGGAADLTVPITPYSLGQNAAMAQQSIVAGAGTTQIFAGAYSGGVTVPTCANMTIGTGTYLLYSAYAFFSAYETTPTTGTRTRGLTCSTDDLGYVIVTVGESIPATTLTAASTLTSFLSSGGGGGGVVATGLVAEYVGKLAKAGTAPGNNTDPTGTWDDLQGAYDGTLNAGFAYSTASGWAGDGSAGDPYRLVFAGTDDGLTLGDPGIGEDKTFSIEVWFKGFNSAVGATLAGCMNTTAGSRWASMLNLYTSASNIYLRGFLGQSTAYGAMADFYGSTILSDSVWNHAVFTSDGTTAYLYLNGVAETGATPFTITNPTGAIDQNTASMGFLNNSAPGSWYTGAIPTVRFYNACLSPTDVAANYAAGVLAASTDVAGGAALSQTPPPATALTAASTLTGFAAGSASLSVPVAPTTLTAASTLTGMVAGAAALANTVPPARALTAASTLTAFTAAAASLSHTPPAARSLTAASTLTAFTAASVSLSHTPPVATTLTAASTLTAFTAASAALSHAPPAARSLTAASTLTGFTAASATIGNTAPAAKTLTGSSTLTAFTAASASLASSVSTALTAASTLTGFTAGSASVRHHPASTPPGSAYNVMDYGAHADGTTDDCDHIASAATAAVAGGGHVYFPPGTYALAQQGFYYSLSCLANAYYYAPSGVTWKTYQDVRPASGATIDGVNFSWGAGSRAISDYQLAGRPLISDFTVKNCTGTRADLSEYSHCFIWQIRGANWILDSNILTGPIAVSGSNRGNIIVSGGYGAHITNNAISGGTTSILHMWSPSGNGGGLDSVIRDEVITGNVYSNYLEEGISFDVNGTATTGEGGMEYDAIASVSGQDITLSALTFPSYVGYDVVFVDGALRGRTRTITAQSGTGNKVFTVSGNLSGASAGDNVVVAAPFKHNYIAYNNGTSQASANPYSAIILYGMCFGNVIEYNTVVLGKIKVQSLDYLPVYSGSATGAHSRAPCGYNTVRGNTISDANGRVYLEYYALGGAYTPFISEGNNVIDNTTPNLSVTNQDFYRSGNSGTYTDGGGNSESGSPFTYDHGALETTLTAASTLTAFTSASASLSHTAPAARSLAAASTLTALTSAAASLSHTAPAAKTITAASTLTGFTSASASLSHTPPAARSLTASSTLTGFTAGSASITSASGPVITAASTLTAFVSAAAALSHTAPPARSLTATSTLTGMTAGAASVSWSAAGGVSLAAASTLTSFTHASASISHTAPPAKTLTAASTLTVFTHASASLNNTAPGGTTLTGSSTLTAFTSAAASLSHTAPAAKTFTGASTLTGYISASANLAHTAPAARTLTAASTLSAVVSASASLGGGMPTTMTAASTLTGRVSGVSYLALGAPGAIRWRSPRPWPFNSHRRYTLPRLPRNLRWRH